MSPRNPNRPTLLTGVLAAGLVGGVVIAIVGGGSSSNGTASAEKSSGIRGQTCAKAFGAMALNAEFQGTGINHSWGGLNPIGQEPADQREDGQQVYVNGVPYAVFATSITAVPNAKGDCAYNVYTSRTGEKLPTHDSMPTGDEIRAADAELQRQG